MEKSVAYYPEVHLVEDVDNIEWWDLQQHVVISLECGK